MGLMDRDYMNRTPEEREAEYKSKMSEERKHEQRKVEMYRLMAKGNDLTFSERRRLKKIFKENQTYMARTATYSDYENYDYKTQNPQSTSNKRYSSKNNSSIVPIVIFIVVLIFIVLTFYFYPDLANFNIWN